MVLKIFDSLAGRLEGSLVISILVSLTAVVIFVSFQNFLLLFSQRVVVDDRRPDDR